MKIETERKFLVKDQSYKNETHDFKQIAQGYICSDGSKTVRVRIKGDEGFITFKGISVNGTRPEYEYTIPLQDAKDMIDIFCGEVVSKTRHYVRYEGILWEVDEFSGENRGLVMAEVELPDITQKIVIPHWIGREVTGDLRYYNSYLLKNPYKKWN